MNLSDNKSESFHLSVDSIPMPIAIFRLEDGIFVDCNESFSDYLQLDTKQLLIGNTLLDFSPTIQFDGDNSYDKYQTYKEQLESAKILSVNWSLNVAEQPKVVSLSLMLFTRKNTNYMQLSIIKEVIFNETYDDWVNESIGLESIGKNVQHSIWILNKNYELIYGNDRFIETYKDEYGIDLKVGQNILSEDIDSSIRELWKSYFDSTLNNINTEKIELKLLKNMTVEIYTIPISVGSNLIAVLYYGIDITEKKKVELELEASNNNYRYLYNLLRSMTDAIPDMIWAKDMKSEYTFANKSLCNNFLFAKDVNEPIGKTDMFFMEREIALKPEDPEWFTMSAQCANSDQKILKTKEGITHTESGYIRGKFLYFDTYKAPLYDSKGEMIGSIGISRDTTLQKEIENSLKKSEATSRGILNSITELIYITDKDNIIIDINDAVEKKYGYNKSEIIGKPPIIFAAKPETDRELVEELLSKAFKGIPQNYIFLNKKKNGSLFTKETTAVAGVYFGQEVVISVGRDITERLKASKVLKESEGRYRALFEIMEQGVLNFDQHGEIIDFNKSACDILGLSADEIKSSKDIDDSISKYYLKGEEYSNKKSPIFTSLKVGKSVINKTVHIVSKKSNVSKWIIINVVPLFHPNQTKPYHVFVKLNDISLQKESEIALRNAKERAEESDRLKSAFLANMSHEIRTPMNGIMGFANLLKRHSLTGEKKEHYIDIIIKSGNRMLSLINDLVDISKIESGQIDVNLSEANINKELDNIYDFFNPELLEKNMQFIIKKSLIYADANIITDSEKLYAILANLVKNAIKYSEVGYIELGYIVKNEDIEFYVQDTGIGIPEDNMTSVFNRFVQAKNISANTTKGVGLGLSIAKAYVEMLGGEIWLESKENVGTSFYFTVPFKKTL